MNKNIEKLFNAVDQYVSEPLIKLDLKNNKDYEKFNKILDDTLLRIDDLKKSLFTGTGSLFADCFDAIVNGTIKENIMKLKSYAKEYHERHNNVTDSEINKTKASDKLSDEMYKQIGEITNEYIKSQILPYAQKTGISDETIKNVYDGLFEFAAWIYTK